MTEREVQMARQPYPDKTHTVAEICATLGISRTTFYRYGKGGRKRNIGDEHLMYTAAIALRKLLNEMFL